MIKHIVSILLAVVAIGCSHNGHEQLQRELEAYVADKDATIGIAVITEDGDTTGVNIHRRFPMCSVVKFPLALHVCDYAEAAGINLEDSLTVTAADLRTDTYSPMLTDYAGLDTIRITIRTLLDYSLRLSDNNACDILFSATGGPAELSTYLGRLGHNDINVKWNENDMHQDISRSFDNTSTPAAMAVLFEYFDRDCVSPSHQYIKQTIEQCATGNDRLPAPFLTGNAITGHKTGTGDIDGGRIIAVNDAGYVHMPDGSKYYIAVFIENSAYGLDETSAMIGEISSIVAVSLAKH